MTEVAELCKVVGLVSVECLRLTPLAEGNGKWEGAAPFATGAKTPR